MAVTELAIAGLQLDLQAIGNLPQIEAELRLLKAWPPWVRVARYCQLAVHGTSPKQAEESGGETERHLCALARELGLWLVPGSFVDSNIVRAHQHAAAAKKGAEDQPIGGSPGGLSTKIHPAVRGLGSPVRFHVHRRPNGRCASGGGFDREPACQYVMADTAYDADRLRPIIVEKGELAVIPSNPSRAGKHPLDEQHYAQRSSSSPASQRSSSAEASQHDSKRPRPTISPSSLLPQPSADYGKCPHHLGHASDAE